MNCIYFIKGGVIMCQKLKELEGKLPMDILNSVFASSITIPIDLDKILEQLGVKKIPSSFDDLEKTIGVKQGSISGLVLYNEKDLGIYYKKDDELYHKRLTIAHELGHCCKHGQNLENNYIEMFCDNQDVNEAEEAEATLFASQLLIPEKQLKDFHSKLVQPSLQKLSELFEVPKDLMLKRIVDLKMAYYDDDKKEMIPPCL